MTPGERKTYFALWGNVCRVNGWRTGDDERRRAVVLECMRAVRGPLVTTSDKRFRSDEITALLTYLRHLAAPDDLDASARWVTCCEDYKTFNRAKQADWHEREMYGSGKNKLDRDRFAGAASASGGPLDTLDEDEVRKRHITMASRHQRKMRQARRAEPTLDLTSTPAPQPAYATAPAGAEDDGNPF